MKVESPKLWNDTLGVYRPFLCSTGHHTWTCQTRSGNMNNHETTPDKIFSDNWCGSGGLQVHHTFFCVWISKEHLVQNGQDH